MTDPLVILGVAGAAALASPIGGLIAIWRKPTTLFMSIALGFASGVLLGTICFSMLAQALELSSIGKAAGGFAIGFAAVFAFDLFIHRWKVAGERAEQRPQVERFYQRRRPRGSEVSVLAGGTSVEELIEGLSIGIGAAIKPGLGLLIALAIVVDNLAEALSIGEIIRSEPKKEGAHQERRILGWTGLIGIAILVSTFVGWFFLRWLSPSVLGFLFGVGGGGMFYLVVTDLVPEAEERQYQESAALSIGIGFLAMFILSQFLHGR
jgi:zinc transporter, ZIP family